MSKRIFAGVPFLENNHLLLNHCAAICNRHKGWRIVQPSAWHVTLVFPGNVTEERYQQIRAGCASMAAAFPPFTLKSDRLALMPENAPSMIWLQMQLTDAFAHAHERFHAQLQVDTAYGPNPHVTVMRCSRGTPPPAPDELRMPHAFELHAKQLLIYESFLQPGGSRYEVLDRFNLGIAT